MVEGTALDIEVEDVARDTPGVVRTVVLEDADVLSVRETTASLESVYFDVMGVQPPRATVS